MILNFQRSVRRLRGVVRRSRPGTGHAARIDGWPLIAWRTWDWARRANLEALRIATPSLDEAARLARAYWGTDFWQVEEQVDRGSVTTWCCAVAAPRLRQFTAGRGEQFPAGAGVPLPPAALLHHDPRVLARALVPAALLLEIAGVTYEPA